MRRTLKQGWWPTHSRPRPFPLSPILTITVPGTALSLLRLTQPYATKHLPSPSRTSPQGSTTSCTLYMTTPTPTPHIRLPHALPSTRTPFKRPFPLTTFTSHHFICASALSNTPPQSSQKHPPRTSADHESRALRPPPSWAPPGPVSPWSHVPGPPPRALPGPSLEVRSEV